VASDRLLTAYETVPSEGFELVPAPHGREWMDSTYDRSAYRCLPMLMANQAGWMIHTPTAVQVHWDGGMGLDAVHIASTQLVDCPSDCEMPPMAMHVHLAALADSEYQPISHFGAGVLTWTLPFLFRTPKGYNLLVRGPANGIKDGIAPLEGLVETDWAPGTFTMNWKITRPDTWITFERGEPICMVVPQRRGELEEFVPRILPLAEDAGLEASNAAWCESRDEFNAERKWEDGKWERHYFQGTAPDGSVAAEHQTRLRLQGFTREPT
jgi:hypothetical protein